MNPRAPLVSVIVPTRNAAGRLPETLASIAAQTHPAVEVIVVDNHSTDETAAVAERSGARVLSASGERSAQMNAGIRVARGTYVYRIDDDFLLGPTLIADAVAVAEREGFDGIVTWVRSQGDGFWARVKGLERDSYVESRLIAGVRFIRRDVLAAVGGFDETLVAGEDYDLDFRLRRAGYRIGSLTSAFEFHRGEPRSLTEVARKGFFYGRTIPRYIRKYPLRSLYQFLPIRPAILRHWRDFARHPDLALGFLVHQAVKYTAAALGVAVGLVTGGIGRRRYFPEPTPIRLPPRAQGSRQPWVSVIVPTRNAAETLPACLVSVRNQNYPNVECIVVDNRSTDGTPGIGRTADRFLTAGPERSAQRNVGSRVARGQYLLFIDADMELTPNVVDEAVALAADGGVGAIIVPEQVYGHRFFASVRMLENRCYYGDDLIEAPRFFTREAFETVGGYDTNLIASEDWDLALRLRERGYRTGRIRALIIHNEGVVTLRRAFAKKFYYGRNLRRYIVKHPLLAIRQLQPFRPAFWRNRHLLWQDPLHAAGVVVLRAAETLAGILGVLVDVLHLPFRRPQREP